MIQFSAKGRKKDFGDLGDDSSDGSDSISPGSVSSGLTSGFDFSTPSFTSTSTASGSTAATPSSGTKGSSSSGSGSSSSSNPLTSLAGGLLGTSGVCGSCGSAANTAANNEKAALAAKYPLQTCTTPPTAACTAFNAQQTALQNQEFNAWQAAQDLQTGATLSASDKTALSSVNVLASNFMATHPQYANMTLAQIFAADPTDFDAIYAQMQQQYPLLQGIDPATALAMSPAISGMTLQQLVTRTANLSAGATSPLASTSGGGGTMTVALLAAVAAGVLLFIKGRSNN